MGSEDEEGRGNQDTRLLISSREHNDTSSVTVDVYVVILALRVSPVQISLSENCTRLAPVAMSQSTRPCSDQLGLFKTGNLAQPSSEQTVYDSLRLVSCEVTIYSSQPIQKRTVVTVVIVEMEKEITAGYTNGEGSGTQARHYERFYVSQYKDGVRQRAQGKGLSSKRG